MVIQSLNSSESVCFRGGKMLQKQDIHRYERRFNNMAKTLEPLSEVNRNLIFSCKNYLFTRDLSKPRVIKYMEVLKKVSDIVESSDEFVNKDISKLTKNEIQSLIGIIQEKDYSPWTKQSYRVIIKKFFCWVENCDEGIIPDKVRWIKINFSRAEAKLPGEGDLINKEEVQRAIDTCDRIRDRAFISILYESGARIGEIASLRMSNLVFDQYGVQVNVLGKTGARRIRLVNSAFLLKTLVETHPFREDRHAPLWLNSNELEKKEAMKYSSFKTILNVAFRRAGIKKRCNPHLFRHSRATEMASYLTEFQMNQYFGWKQGSDMPSTYVHMNGKEVEGAVLAMNGIIKEERIESEDKAKICPRCEKLNPSNTDFCLTCNIPLDTRTAINLEQRDKEQKKMNLIMNELIKEPEVQKLLVKKIRELGLESEILNQYSSTS